MTAGHPNAGYDKIVTRFELALNNPSGNRTTVKPNKEELKDILTKSKAIWAAKDDYETTYGNSFRNHNLKEKLYVRPSSPTRKNNPHPSKVFMSSHLRHIPGYFDDNPEHLNQENNAYNSQEMSQASASRPATSSLYRNSNHYLQNLPSNEANEMKATFHNAGIDTLSSNNEPVQSGIYSSNSIQKQNTKPKITLQSNLTNPYLYNDLREYKEKYANNDHGMPHPDAQKPSRGDFMIHPDWHAKLKHHHLPCDC